MRSRRLPGRGRASVSSAACAVVLLAGGIAATVGDPAPDPPAASATSGDRVDEAWSANGRIRSRMIADLGATARVLDFEVQVRDRTWLTAEDRLVRVVLRRIPDAERAFPLGVRRGDAPGAAAAAGLPGAEGRHPGPPEPADRRSARQSSSGYRTAVLPAPTPPGAMAELTYLTATLDVTGLARGDYVATVELLDTTLAGRSSPGRAFPLDRTVHRYSAQDPPSYVVCCPREFRDE